MNYALHSKTKQKKISKFWLAVALLDIAFIVLYFQYTHAQVAPFTCPAGQYQIDIDTCKDEPTGCPFGDSIPIDSPKCVPPSEDQNSQVPYNANEPKDEQPAVLGK